MFVITIKRAVASTYFRTYERSSARLGYALTIVQIGMVILLSFLVVIFYDFGLVYARCTIVREKGQTLHMIQGTGLILLQFYTTITFFRLLTLNKRRTRVGCYSLSERYQIAENVKTLDLSHISINLIIVFFFMVVQSLNLSRFEHDLDEEALGFIHLHSLIVPAIVYGRMRRNSQKRQRILRTNHVDDGFVERYREI
ncbi:hypothetical protein PMAYCL1PPCAC_22868, partial [Pristionchus mayeri]